MSFIGCFSKRSFFLLIFLLCFPLFAENVCVHSIHFSSPLEFRLLDKNNSPSRKYFDLDSEFNAEYYGACINYSRLVVRESRLSFLLGCALGAGFVKIPELASDYMFGELFIVKGGAGFAPVLTEKMILAFHGFCGFNFRFYDYTSNYEAGDISDKLDLSGTEYNFVSGLDAVFVLKLGQRVSLFSSLGVSTIPVGWGNICAERDGAVSDFSELSYKNILNGVSIEPGIGLCFGF